MVDHVFPEDSGTGATEGDWSDAANFAQLADAVGLTDYVVRGLGFTYDSATPALDIGQGVAVVTDSSATATNTSEARDGVAYVAEADARTNLSLTDGAVNEVFLSVDLTADDTLSYSISADGSTPASQPWLKIGEVDTSADTTTTFNRRADFLEALDSGTSIADVGSLNFGTDLTVTDDGDGQVTIDASGSSTDTRVESQDAGTQLYVDTTALNFDSTTDLTVTDNGSGKVTIGSSSTSTDTRVETQDAGTQLYADTTALNLDSTTNLSVSDDGNGTVTVGASGGSGGSNLGQPYYLCYESGGTYYVKNLETGSTASSGTDGATQLQYAFDNLPTTSARPVVAIRDEWTISSQVDTSQSDFTIDAGGAYLEAAGDNSVLNISNNDVWLVGGTFDGSNQTDGTSSLRVINLNGVDDCMLRDVTSLNSGYYGINAFECNRCRFIHCIADGMADDGFHPASDTSGRNQENVHIGCIARNGTEWGFNDRLGSGTYCGNKYIGCLAYSNGKNGMGVWNGSGNPDLSVTFSDCVSVNNDKNYKIEDGDHRLVNCLSDGAATSGIELNDRSNPSTANVTITLDNCKFLDANATGVAWSDTNLLMRGGSVSSYYDGSSVGTKKFKDVDGITGSDANAYVWVDGYATSSGSPTASDYETGMIVEDSDSTGTLYFISPTGSYAI